MNKSDIVKALIEPNSNQAMFNEIIAIWLSKIMCSNGLVVVPTIAMPPAPDEDNTANSTELHRRIFKEVLELMVDRFNSVTVDPDDRITADYIPEFLDSLIPFMHSFYRRFHGMGAETTDTHYTNMSLEIKRDYDEESDQDYVVFGAYAVEFTPDPANIVTRKMEVKFYV